MLIVRTNTGTTVVSNVACTLSHCCDKHREEVNIVRIASRHCIMGYGTETHVCDARTMPYPCALLSHACGLALNFYSCSTWTHASKEWVHWAEPAAGYLPIGKG